MWNGAVTNFGNHPPQVIHTKVWNDTVANLTLMALGSSAPEILLSLKEILVGITAPWDPSLKMSFYNGPLGPSTIVGSAAFNLMASPSPSLRRPPLTFHTRRSPSLTFSHLQPPSAAFAHLRSPSTAFDRLRPPCPQVITGVCIVCLPDGEVRSIKQLGVFLTTSAYSIFAYIW